MAQEIEKKYTQLEEKLIENEYIDEHGQILQGIFKGCFIHESLTSGKNGKTVLSLVYRDKKPGSIVKATNVEISEKEFELCMEMEDYFDFLLVNSVINKIAKPIAIQIAAQAADATWSISQNEINETKWAIAEDKLTAEERKQNSIKHHQKHVYNLTPQAVEGLASTTPEFWAYGKEGLVGLLSKNLFQKLEESSANFTTPEAIVSFRATTNRAIKHCLDVLQEDVGVPTDELSPFTNAYRKFDEKMEHRPMEGIGRKGE